MKPVGVRANSNPTTTISPTYAASTTARPRNSRRVNRPYLSDSHSKPRLNPPNAAASRRDVNPLADDLCACGLSRSAHSAGLKVSDTTQEITVEAAIVTANWRKNCPVIPDRKADGTNTAHKVNAIETSAPPTSSIVRCAASFGSIPA